MQALHFDSWIAGFRGELIRTIHSSLINVPEIRTVPKSHGPKVKCQMLNYLTHYTNVMHAAIYAVYIVSYMQSEAQSHNYGYSIAACI